MKTETIAEGRQVPDAECFPDYRDLPKERSARQDSRNDALKAKTIQTNKKRQRAREVKTRLKERERKHTQRQTDEDRQRRRQTKRKRETKRNKDGQRQRQKKRQGQRAELLATNHSQQITA
jgi:hypothetical protein